MGESIRFRIAGRPIDVPVADAEQLVVDLETIGVLRAVGSPSSAAATIRHAIARVDEQREFQLDREGEFAVLATLEAAPCGIGIGPFLQRSRRYGTRSTTRIPKRTTRVGRERARRRTRGN